MLKGADQVFFLLQILLQLLLIVFHLLQLDLESLDFMLGLLGFVSLADDGLVELGFCLQIFFGLVIDARLDFLVHVMYFVLEVVNLGLEFFALLE